MPRVRLPVSFALLLLGCGDEGSAPADGSTGSTTAEPASSSTGASATEAPAADGSSSASDSTGPASVCGNGLVEVEEECDDRNVVDGDACYSNCTVPFEVLWTATYDGGGDDDAVAARFDAEGNLYVLGTTDVVGQGSDLWLHRYGPDGREGATWTYDGAQHGDDRANAMTWVDGDLVIVGSELTAIGRDSLVIRLSVDSLAAVWIQRFDGPGTGTSGDDYAVGVTVDPAGDLLVASTEGTDTEGADMALRKLDPDGNVLWIDHYDDPLFHQLDLATAVVADLEGNAYLLGQSQVSGGVVGVVRKLDPDGGVSWTYTLSLDRPWAGTLDAAGNLLLAGEHSEGISGNFPWVARYDPDFMQLGEAVAEGPGRHGGVAVDPTGDVYTAGSLVAGSGLAQGIDRRASDLSMLWWSDTNGADDGLLDGCLGVTPSDEGSRLAVVGYVQSNARNEDAWIRMYRNAPTP
ncbi:MAG: hypothetical protein H6712_11740 [Myxococcales bacterium]|nr:hypothetical protein [Myxococcales bacterium]